MSNSNIFHTFRTSCILLREIYRCSKKPWHWTGRIVLSRRMIQGILCFRIDCCGHEIAGSDDGIVNLGHTHLDPRAYKRTKRGTCIVSPSCSLLSLQYLAKINDDDVRRILPRCRFLSRIFHSANRFRKFSTAICPKDGAPPENLWFFRILFPSVF